MAARRYEISLQVLKNISRVSAANEWNIFQHEKRNFVSPSGHVMFYLLYKYQWNAKPFHFNIFLAAKGAVYHVAIATVIFSHVKITCYFHMWRYHVFVRKLTWYFIGIYIIKTITTLTKFALHFWRGYRRPAAIAEPHCYSCDQSSVKTDHCKLFIFGDTWNKLLRNTPSSCKMRLETDSSKTHKSVRGCLHGGKKFLTLGRS